MAIKFSWSNFGKIPQDAMNIREKVFVEEQGFDEEFDETDNNCFHLMMYIDDMPAGTSRIFWDVPNEVVRLGRFAIYKEYRGGGRGRAMMEECMKKATEIGGQYLVLNAQKRALQFYLACGMKIVGDMFLEEGYPHYPMKYNLKV